MKSFLKKLGLAETARDILRIIDYPRMWYCRIVGKPYFGPVYGATQGSFFRYPEMGKLLKEKLRGAENPKDFKVLEVGSWAGGSTIVFGRICQVFGASLYAVDHWQGDGWESPMMENALKNDRIYKLFTHNIYSSGLRGTVRVLRANSDDILTMLRARPFDFIYIDGGHNYEQVKEDIENCLPLLKEGGTICGDDLELQADEVKELPDKGWATENGKGYHPGVTKAVWEKFGKVKTHNGFWVVENYGS